MQILSSALCFGRGKSSSTSYNGIEKAASLYRLFFFQPFLFLTTIEKVALVIYLSMNDNYIWILTENLSLLKLLENKNYQTFLLF